MWFGAGRIRSKTVFVVAVAMDFFNGYRGVALVCHHLVLVVTMVIIIGLVVRQGEESPLLYKDPIPTRPESGGVGRHGIHGSHRVLFWRREHSQSSENKYT